MKIVAISVVGAAFVCQQAVLGGSPTILSLQPNGALAWTSNYSNNIAVIEASSNLQPAAWTPYFYDLASNSAQVTHMPPLTGTTGFYRLGIRTNIPDPSLVLRLTFDNDFTNSGVILDVSGYGNHAIRYSLTNWPGVTNGPDGHQAARFHRVGTFEGGGDYAGVPYTTNSPFYSLTNGTVMAWAHYTTNSYGASTIVDASSYSYFPGSWFLGRNYSYGTRFMVYDTNQNAYYGAVYPDDSTPNFATDGWHHYAVTWNGTNFFGYYDGALVSTSSQAGFPALVAGGHPWSRWLAIGCQTHDGTPAIDGDGYPNNAWMDGEIDEVRIYNRALGAGEISTLYNSQKK